MKRKLNRKKENLGVSFVKNLCIPANQRKTDVGRDMKTGRTRENMMKRTEEDEEEEEEDTETGNQSVVASV